MIVLAFLLAGVCIWNFVVGVWWMGIILLLLCIWSVAEVFTDDDDFYYY